MPKPTKGESKQDYLARCTRDLISNEGRDSDQAFAMCNAYWDDAKAKASKPITLTAELSMELAKSDDGSDGNGFMMTAYTGQILDLGWFGRYVFSIDGMKAKAKIPILREHKRDRVVGYSKKAWADNGNFLISGEFSKSTRDAKEVKALAEEGYPWQASVGIAPSKIKTLDSDKESMVVNGQEVSGPIEIWLESKVGEVSFVSLGADDDTAAIALREQPFQEAGVPPEGEIKMTLQELQSKHPDIYQEVFSLGAASIDTGKLQAEANENGVKAERERVTKLLSAKANAEVTAKAIQEGTSVEAAGWEFFQAEKQEQEARAKKLAEMESQKPESAGHGAKEAKKPDGDFAKLREAYQKEHNCGLGTATSAIARQYPEIHKAWLDSQN